MTGLYAVVPGRASLFHCCNGDRARIIVKSREQALALPGYPSRDESLLHRLLADPEGMADLGPGCSGVSRPIDEMSDELVGYHGELVGDSHRLGQMLETRSSRRVPLDEID